MLPSETCTSIQVMQAMGSCLTNKYAGGYPCKRYYGGCAIVDEIDSILIDEARTPLIISAPAQESSDMYMKFAHIADSLVEGDDYNVDEKQRAIALTEEGITKAETSLGISNIYSVEGMKYVHHLETAVKANILVLPEMKCDKVSRSNNPSSLNSQTFHTAFFRNESCCQGTKLE